MKRWLALLALWFAVPGASMAAEDAAQTLRDRGVEFCFGRVYDSAHLARNKRQNLSALFVFKDFSNDPLSEDKPFTREQSIAIEQKPRVRLLASFGDIATAVSSAPIALAKRLAPARSIVRPTAKSSPNSRWNFARPATS